jgi:large subunit ribosomal protein L5
MGLQEKFKTKIAPELSKKLGLANSMLLPKLQKIVVNVSTGEALTNSKILDGIAKEVGMITGQKPVLRRAKKSIAGFKLRKGQALGVSVTLRNNNMYEFYSRLVNIALPRTRDFKGLSKKSFDGNGNYSLGINEQIIFPEILPEKVDKIRGMNITFVTSAKTDDQGRELLTSLGFPFRS